MADRPILFSGPMVRAILEGRKTQTRRVLKPPTKGIYEHPKMGGWAASTVGGTGCYLDPGRTIPTPEHACIWHQTTGTTILPPYAPGDRLYVRGEYSFDHSWTGVPPRDVIACSPVHYWADGNPARGDWTKPKPGMHMPRWASRLTLTVTDVRMQRLQDISEDDAVAEGLLRLKSGRYVISQGDQYAGVCSHRPSQIFGAFWDHLNAKRGFGWDANPWVCAVTFTAQQRNIDQMPGAGIEEFP